MVLHTRRWGEKGGEDVVCVHGIAQHGGVFEPLGEHLAKRGYGVLAVDLRGHGDSGREPPWNVERHLEDVLETLDACDVRSTSWVGHSFGARVAAALAAAGRRPTRRLILLEPALQVSAGHALRRAELERLDWSFEGEDGAVNALLGGEQALAGSRQRIVDYVRTELRQGPDGRYRFAFSPAAIVTAWSEMVLPPPPVAGVPTLIVRAEAGTADSGVERRYRERLGDQLQVAQVPHGHNVLWDSPAETSTAVAEFLAANDGQVVTAAGREDAAAGYFEASGRFRPLL